MLKMSRIMKHHSVRAGLHGNCRSYVKLTHYNFYNHQHLASAIKYYYNALNCLTPEEKGMEIFCILTYGAKFNLVRRPGPCFADLCFFDEPTVCFST